MKHYFTKNFTKYKISASILTMIQGTQTEPQINEQKGENFEKEVNFWRLFDKWFFGQSKKEDPFKNQAAKGYYLSKVLVNLFLRYTLL